MLTVLAVVGFAAIVLWVIDDEYFYGKYFHRLKLSLASLIANK